MFVNSCDDFLSIYVSHLCSTSKDIPFASHCHDTNCAVGMGLALRLKNDVDGVRLRFPTRGCIVAVSHPFGIIEAVRHLSLLHQSIFVAMVRTPGQVSQKWALTRALLPRAPL